MVGSDPASICVSRAGYEEYGSRIILEAFDWTAAEMSTANVRSRRADTVAPEPPGPDNRADLRQCFGDAARAPRPTDHQVLARVGTVVANPRFPGDYSSTKVDTTVTQLVDKTNCTTRGKEQLPPNSGALTPYGVVQAYQMEQEIKQTQNGVQESFGHNMSRPPIPKLPVDSTITPMVADERARLGSERLFSPSAALLSPNGMSKVVNAPATASGMPLARYLAAELDKYSHVKSPRPPLDPRMYQQEDVSTMLPSLPSQKLWTQGPTEPLAEPLSEPAAEAPHSEAGSFEQKRIARMKERVAMLSPRTREASEAMRAARPLYEELPNEIIPRSPIFVQRVQQERERRQVVVQSGIEHDRQFAGKQGKDVSQRPGKQYAVDRHRMPNTVVGPPGSAPAEPEAPPLPPPLPTGPSMAERNLSPPHARPASQEMPQLPIPPVEGKYSYMPPAATEQQQAVAVAENEKAAVAVAEAEAKAEAAAAQASAASVAAEARAAAQAAEAAEARSQARAAADAEAAKARAAAAEERATQRAAAEAEREAAADRAAREAQAARELEAQKRQRAAERTAAEAKERDQAEKEEAYRAELAAKRAARGPAPALPKAEKAPLPRPVVPKLDLEKTRVEEAAAQDEHAKMMAEKAAASREQRRRQEQEAMAAKADADKKAADAKAAKQAEWAAADAENAAADAENARVQASEVAAAERKRSLREEKEKTGEDRDVSPPTSATKRSNSPTRRLGAKGRRSSLSEEQKAANREQQNRELEEEKRRKAEAPSQYAVQNLEEKPTRKATPKVRDADTAKFIAEQEKRMKDMTADLSGEDEDDFAEMMAAENAKRGL